MWNTSFERAGKFLLILSELGLILAVVYVFNIERLRHLFPVLCFVTCGFAIHLWLPFRRDRHAKLSPDVDHSDVPPVTANRKSGEQSWSEGHRTDFRLIFFSLLSVASILFVLGAVNGVSVLGIGALLIGICYLPITNHARIGLLLCMAAILVALRIAHPLPFWPIVGSMFMFRLITFVYESRREMVKPPLAWTLSYFFMLPNACFPLFPIVDYKTFVMTRYDQDEWVIYQRGVEWMSRGLVHLLLYRAIKSYVVPDVSQLYDFTQIAIFVAANYALYLQVSGHFHLVTGILHLFGFDLPRTHHFYFLASSFSDIWRRINIYWKDFMTKYVFYPAFYAIRRRGTSAGRAMVLSVLLVFIATWLLHSWQTFWLLGRFPLSVNDACLWLGAGGLVAVNSVIDLRRQPLRFHSVGLQSLVTSVRTVGMFSLVSLFWSCWTMPGFMSLVANSLNRPGASRGMLLVAMSLLLVVAGGTLAQLARSWWIGSYNPFRYRGLISPNGRRTMTSLSLKSLVPFLQRAATGSPSQQGDSSRTGLADQSSLQQSTDMSFQRDSVDAARRAGVVQRANDGDSGFSRSVQVHLATLSIILVSVLPGSSALLDDETVRNIRHFRDDPTLTLAAGEKLQSYYEDLNKATIQAGPLLSSFTAVEDQRRQRAEGFLKVSRNADLYQGTELIPGIQTELDGKQFTVNLYGMRDRNSISFDKSDKTYRIALVGSSIVMGYGVADDEVFGRQFESLLNESRADSQLRFEVLNFGVGKQWAPQRLIRIQRRVFGFSPDALFYFAHQDEFKELASHSAQLISLRRELPSKTLRDAVARAGVTSRQPPGEVLSRLTRFEPELLEACYRTIVEECHRRGTVPVWIYLPIPGQGASELRDRLVPLAAAAGFVTCDLSDWAEGHSDLFPAAEFHPNAQGHALIAEALMRMVQQFPETLSLQAARK